MGIENWIAKMDTMSSVSCKLHWKHGKTRNRLFFARYAARMKSEQETMVVLNRSNCTNDWRKEVICEKMKNAECAGVYADLVPIYGIIFCLGDVRGTSEQLSVACVSKCMHVNCAEDVWLRCRWINKHEYWRHYTLEDHQRLKVTKMIVWIDLLILMAFCIWDDHEIRGHLE